MLAGPGRDSAARSLQAHMLTLLPLLADSSQWKPEFFSSTEELLPLDRALVQALEGLGGTGKILAAETRLRLADRLQRHFLFITSSSKKIPDIFLEDWCAPPDGPTWKEQNCPDPAGARAWRLLALATWRDEVRPAAIAAATLLMRHPAPAIASGILQGTIQKLAFSRAELGEDGAVYLRDHGERLKVAAAVAPEVAEALLRGLNELGGVIGDRLIRAAVRWAWERRGALDARNLRFEGGRATLRDRLSIPKNQDAALYDALEAGAMFRFKRGGMEVLTSGVIWRLKLHLAEELKQVGQLASCWPQGLPGGNYR